MDFLKTLLQDVRPDGLLFDIGANEGGYTWLMRQHCPTATIYAFEPIPALYQGLVARYRTDDRIITVHKGVSDRAYEETGVAVHEAWTIDKPERARRGRNATWGGETFDIGFTTVDDVMDLDAYGRDKFDLPKQKCDFLKIDTDGYDFRVLKGAEHTILRDRPPILIELGYCVADLGDAIPDFLGFIYGVLNYRLFAQDATCWPTYDVALGKYPYHTTWDMAMLPAETPLRPLD